MDGIGVTAGVPWARRSTAGPSHRAPDGRAQRALPVEGGWASEEPSSSAGDAAPPAAQPAAPPPVPSAGAGTTAARHLPVPSNPTPRAVTRAETARQDDGAGDAGRAGFVRDTLPAGAAGSTADNADGTGTGQASWIEALRKGDPEALYRLAATWAPQLYRHAVRLGVDPERAQDLTQETMVRALRSLRAGRVPQHPGAWLYTILTNLIRDDARSAYRQRVELVAPATAASPPWEGRAVPVATGGGASVGADPAALVSDRDERLQTAHRMRAALMDLPLAWRQVVVLRVLEERPVAEVAALLGVAEGTVKSRLHRALKALRQALAADERGGGGAR